MFKWLNSIRATSVIIVLLTLSIALFLKIIEANDYLVIASAVVTAYFGKRDENKVK